MMSVTKTLHLLIIIASIVIATSYAKPVHADSTDPVQILDVQVEPSTLKVNDTFLISATILNSSPYPIYVETNDCTGAFSIIFDIHAKTVYPNINCTTEAILQKVDPEGEATISNANKPGIIYQAVWAGTANANITIPYSAKNQTATDYSSIEYTASKSFQFLIHDSNETSQKPIQAENINSVEIQDIQVQPAIVKTGDTFSIKATLVNNSTSPIYVETNDCTGAFSIIFDNHVNATTPSACTYMLMEHRLDPSEKFTSTNPPSSITYKATSSGTVNATVTFSYSQLAQEEKISKSFFFTINDNSTQTIPVYPNHSRPAYSPQYPMTPLEQFKSGISAQDVKCPDGYTLIIKAEDGSPACVKPDTANILFERGWAKIKITIADFNVIESSNTSNIKNNDPFGITALIIYNPSLGCLGPPGNGTSGGCPPNNFYLKINSNSTAYLLGYNICDGNSCAKNSGLSVLLPINTILKPNYQMIGLPVNLQWKDGDTVSIQLQVSPTLDNKTGLLIDHGNSTIVPQ